MTKAGARKRRPRTSEIAAVKRSRSRIANSPYLHATTSTAATIVATMTTRTGGHRLRADERIVQNVGNRFEVAVEMMTALSFYAPGGARRAGAAGRGRGAAGDAGGG